MESSVVIPELVDARVGPRGSLENLSQAEITKLLDSSQVALRDFARPQLALHYQVAELPCLDERIEHYSYSYSY